MSAFSRRAFLRLGGSFALGSEGFDSLWSSKANLNQAEARQGLPSLPRLDGSLATDQSALERAADDLGHITHHRPAGVLRPASTQDVIRIVRFAGSRGIKVAMRGQGHCRYGQAQVPGGIVIDSATLKAVRLIDDNNIEAEAGATWTAVADAALAVGRTPRVLPDALVISVGGVLSVGGIGNTSQHFGSIADNVTELDVITGEGRLVTCSMARNRELFEMALAGLGQCGLIVRARLRLMPAPDRVTLHDLDYTDLRAFLTDNRSLLLGRRFEHQDGRMVREPSGWRFRIQVGKFGVRSDGNAALPSGLAFQRNASRTVSYREYLNRNATAAAAVRTQNFRRPAIVMWLPASAAAQITREILESPAHSAGLDAFYYFPVDTRRFRTPLLRMPGEEVAFTLWLFRSAPIDNNAALNALMESNRRIFGRMRSVGGKFYPPYAFVSSQSEWREHFGADLWKRLSQAKRRFDPKRVLTPGPGIFSS